MHFNWCLKSGWCNEKETQRCCLMMAFVFAYYHRLGKYAYIHLMLLYALNTYNVCVVVVALKPSTTIVTK